MTTREVIATPDHRDMESTGVCCGTCLHYDFDEALCNRFQPGPAITIACLCVCDEWSADRGAFPPGEPLPERRLTGLYGMRRS